MPPGSRFLKIPLFIGFWSTTSLWQTSMMYIHTYIFYLKYFFLAIEYFNSHSRSVAIIHPSQVGGSRPFPLKVSPCLGN